MAEKFKGDFEGGEKHAAGTKQNYQIEQASPEEHSTGGGPPSTLPTESPRIHIITTGLPKNYPGKYGGRYEFLSGDTEVPAGAGQRAELQQYNASRFSGTHVWWHEWIKVEERDAGHYALLRQFHEDEGGVGVAVGIYVEGSTLYVESNKPKIWFSGPFELNKWFRYKLHIYLHQTEGIIEFWLGGESGGLVKQTLTNGKLIYEGQNTISGGSGGGKSVYAKVGINRSNKSTGNTKVVHVGTREWDADPGEVAIEPETEEPPKEEPKEEPPPPGEEEVSPPETPVTFATVPRRPANFVPKLRVPLEVGAGRFESVEQGSAEEVAACVYAIAATPLGARLELPQFGVEDPTFDQLPLEVQAKILAAVAQWEPRATATAVQKIVNDLAGEIVLEVDTR